jgi:hypothetical protein
MTSLDCNPELRTIRLGDVPWPRDPVRRSLDEHADEATGIFAPAGSLRAAKLFMAVLRPRPTSISTEIFQRLGRHRKVRCLG